MDAMLAALPPGDVMYVRNVQDSTWEVGVFEHGAVRRVATVATGMDKGVAAWFAEQLRDARRK